MYQENSNQEFQQQQQQPSPQLYSQQQYDQYYFNYQNYYQQNYAAQYNQYYPYYSYYGQYQQDPVNQQYSTGSYQTLEPKPSTPTPTQIYAQTEGTPEKQNDSGIDVISPQILYQYQSQQLQQQYENKPIEKCDESDDEESIEEQDDDKENDAQATNSKTNASNMDPAKPPKPYLEIIADGILSNKVKMMQLHEIYHFMEKKYEYFAKNVNKSWRNSVRHNLSLNECFVKAGRGSNGKGNYWKIHPACEKEFIRGNFRRKSFKQMIRASKSQRANEPQYNLPNDYSLNYPGLIPPPQISQLTNNPNLSSFQMPAFNIDEQMSSYNQQYNQNELKQKSKSEQRFHPYRV